MFLMILCVDNGPYSQIQGISLNSKIGSTDDYRGISINPVVSKLVKICFLDIFGLYLISSNRQFGFKSKSSCEHGIYSTRKTI